MRDEKMAFLSFCVFCAAALLLGFGLWDVLDAVAQVKQ